MKAIVIREFGDESVLRYEEVPDPQPGPREVLVRVKAASLNRGDLGRRAGTYGGGGQSLPFTPGWEVAGLVEAVGSEVRGRTAGQRVLAQSPAGGYAELMAVHEVGTAPIPESLSFEEAATIPVVFLTSWYALHKIADVQAGEWALVHAAASGVGMAGIQIAKVFGAKVITTASSQEKLTLGLGLGADEAVNYVEQDFVSEVRRITEGRGVDVVLESVGGDVFSRSLLAMAFKGRLVTVGNSARQPVSFEPGVLFGAGLSVSGFSLAAEFATGGPVVELGRILELFARGELRTVVDKTFPLREAPAAHRYLAERRNLGKVVLVP